MPQFYYEGLADADAREATDGRLFDLYLLIAAIDEVAHRLIFTSLTIEVSFTDQKRSA